MKNCQKALQRKLQIDFYKILILGYLKTVINFKDKKYFEKSFIASQNYLTINRKKRPNYYNEFYIMMQKLTL